MKTMKRRIAMLLSIVMLLPMCLTARAEYKPQYTTEAEVLYELGLFKGTGSNADGTPIFDLDKGATRIQGIVMLIRLLGEEEAALACTAEHPFTDVPTWANSYVAYAYEKKYTNGVGNNTFGSDDKLLGKAYVTFVLRALGYNDAAGDFSYNNALTFGAELGLIEAGQCEGELYRDDTALVSYNALRTNLKDTDTKLIEKLEQNGAVTSEAVQKSGLLAEIVYVPYDVATGNLNYSDVYEAIPSAITISTQKFGIVKTENGLLEGYKYHYNQIDFSLRSIYLSDSGINTYACGEILPDGSYKKLPFLVRKPEKQAYINNGTASDAFLTIITILGENHTLVAYSVVPPLYLKDTIAFTICNYNGLEEAEKVRDFLVNFEKKVPEFNADALSYEKVISDGKTQENTYRLKIDETKLPANIRDVKYYSISSKTNGYTSIGFIYGRIHTSLFDDSSEYSNIYAIDAVREIRGVGSGKLVIFLFDENKEIIGYTYTEDSIRVE